MINLTINNKEYQISQDLQEMTLLNYLREVLHLTGTKNGCEIGVCGACTVIIDDIAKRSCRIFLKDLNNKHILTIEGIQRPDGSLHPLQQAFIDEGAIQCGFCTPGMILSAHAFLVNHYGKHTDTPDDNMIKQSINGNICRCTGYQQIINAIKSVTEFYLNIYNSTSTK